MVSIGNRFTFCELIALVLFTYVCVAHLPPLVLVSAHSMPLLSVVLYSVGVIAYKTP